MSESVEMGDRERGPRRKRSPEDFDGLRDAPRRPARDLPKRLKQLAAFALSQTRGDGLRHSGGDRRACGRPALHAGAVRADPRLWRLFASAADLPRPPAGALPRLPRAPARPARRRGARLAARRALEGFLGAAALSLERMRETVQPPGTLARRRRPGRGGDVYLLGARRVFPISAYLAYAFGKLGIRAILDRPCRAARPEQLATATKRDAVLAISFTPYAPITVELAAAASRRGVPVVAITDWAFSPLVSRPTCGSRWRRPITALSARSRRPSRSP